MEPITVKYKVLDSRARTPAYATPGSAAAGGNDNAFFAGVGTPPQPP